MIDGLNGDFGHGYHVGLERAALATGGDAVGDVETARSGSRGGAMAARYNFVQVLNALFEPDLKLRIAIVKPYSDGYSNFQIEIAVDPEIDAHNLTMPPPAWWPKAGSRPASIAFQSDQSRTATTLWGSVDAQPTHIRGVLKEMSRGFAYDAGKLEEAIGDKAAGQGFELLHHIVKAAIDLPFWDEEAELAARDVRRRTVPPPAPMTIGLYLERPLAEQLAAASSFSFDDSVAGDVLVARREARQ